MFHFGTTFRKFNIFFANIVATKPKKSHPPGAMTRNSLAAAMFRNLGMSATEVGYNQQNILI
jgi:hypothetical protein